MKEHQILRCGACGRILKRAAVEVLVDGRNLPLGPGCARARKLLAPVQRRVFTQRVRAPKATAQIPLELGP